MCRAKQPRMLFFLCNTFSPNRPPVYSGKTCTSCLLVDQAFFRSKKEVSLVEALTPSTPFEMRNLNASQHRRYLELYFNNRGLAQVLVRCSPSGMRILERRATPRNMPCWLRRPLLAWVPSCEGFGVPR